MFSVGQVPLVLNPNLWVKNLLYLFPLSIIILQLKKTDREREISRKGFDQAAPNMSIIQCISIIESTNKTFF